MNNYGKYYDYRPNVNRIAAANSTLATGGVSSPLDSFVVAESSVLRTNPDSYRDAEKPAHRRSANCYASNKKLMMKSAFLFIIILSFLLQFFNGHSNKGELQNETSKSDNKKNHSFTESTFTTLSFTDLNDRISEVVRMVFQDSKGNIWFGTQNGAFRLTDKSLTHIDSIRSESGQGVTIKDIAEGQDGIIWVGHTDGISSIDGELVKNYYKSDGLISNDVWCIATDAEGKIWIGTLEGACVFDGKTFTNFELPLGIKDTTVGVSSDKMINKIFRDSKGKIWISSNAGLFSYSNNKLTNVSKKAGIKSNFVSIGFEDKAGVLWLTSKEGLYTLNDGVAKKITDESIEMGKGIGSVAEDKDGKIWFVVNQHYLYTYDGKELLEFQKSEENKGPVVFQIYKDQDKRLWFVGYGGAYRLENGKFLHITKNGPW
jgi:streptogramin lyase